MSNRSSNVSARRDGDDGGRRNNAVVTDLTSPLSSNKTSKRQSSLSRSPMMPLLLSIGSFALGLVLFPPPFSCLRAHTSHEDKDQKHELQPSQTAFETALNEVTRRARSDIGSGSTRREFNLSAWNKTENGGLRDLDRIKLGGIFRNATSVFEWGLGESTFIAAEVGVLRYTGIDSDPTWVSLARDGSPDHFRFHLADIGPTGAWGFPKRRLQKSYLNYQFEPLVSEKPFDVYYVDGRMRVACVLVAFLHASARGETEKEKSPTVILHDYYHDKLSQNCSNCEKQRSRNHYYRIEEVADLVDHSGAVLGVFKRKDNVSDDEIKALWDEMALITH